MKTIILLLSFISLFCTILNSQNLIKSKSFYDTIFSNDKVILERTIIFNHDTININAFYKNDKTDFSFYYSELWDSTSVYYNSKRLIPFKNVSPYFQRYLNESDSIICIEKNNDKYFLLFGTPFFCNGIHCSNISVLFLKVNYYSNNYYCFELDTSFNDYNILKNELFIYFKKHSKIQVNPLKHFLLQNRFSEKNTQ